MNIFGVVGSLVDIDSFNSAPLKTMECNNVCGSFGLYTLDAIMLNGASIYAYIDMEIEEYGDDGDLDFTWRSSVGYRQVDLDLFSNFATINNYRNKNVIEFTNTFKLRCEVYTGAIHGGSGHVLDFNYTIKTAIDEDKKYMKNTCSYDFERSGWYPDLGTTFTRKVKTHEWRKLDSDTPIMSISYK